MKGRIFGGPVGAQSWSTSSPNLDDTHLTLKMMDRKTERKPVSLINFLPASVAWVDSMLCLLRTAYVRNGIFPMTLVIGCLLRRSPAPSVYSQALTRIGSVELVYIILTCCPLFFFFTTPRLNPSPNNRAYSTTSSFLYCPSQVYFFAT